MSYRIFNFSDTKSFKPNLIIEISDDALNAKCNAMASYQYEKRNFPHPRLMNLLEIEQKCGVFQMESKQLRFFK